MVVQCMPNVLAIGAAWAIQGRKNKSHIKDWIFPLLSSHHLFSPIIGHLAFAKGERRTICLGRSYSLLYAHKVGLDVLPWSAILFQLGKEKPL